MKKNWTKEELEQAMIQGQTWTGGAKWLTENTAFDCKDPRTFKRHYQARNEQEESQTTIDEDTYEQWSDNRTPNGFRDPEVEEIIDNHLETKRACSKYPAIIELVDRIERNKVHIKQLKAKNEEYQRSLKNMRIEEEF